MTRITAYVILKELGNDALHKYIYENIAEPTFDSHRIAILFRRISELLRTYADRTCGRRRHPES